MNNFNNPWDDFSCKNKNNDNETDKKTADFDFNNGNYNVKKVLITVLIIVLSFWLATGVYKVNTDEEAVVLYFGKFYKIQQAGLNFSMPYPVGKVIRVATKTINKEEFGFMTDKKNNINKDMESLMLTGDENIVDIDFEVQWKIKDIKDYIFSLYNPSSTIRMSSESIMREIIATRPINDVLANKKLEIETQAKAMMQEILDSYNSGIEIVLVQLLRVDPPEQVINAFRDVQTARADKERKINEAETYRNDLLPRTRGEVESIVKKAEAYKESIISQVSGEVQRFLEVYNNYKNNKTLNKQRIYLETMSEIMKNADKTIIDKSISDKVLQHREIKGK